MSEGEKPELSDEQQAAIDAEVERLLGPRPTEMVAEKPGPDEARPAHGAEEKVYREFPTHYT